MGFKKDTVFLVTVQLVLWSNLCEAILEMGYKVKALDDLSTGKQENIDLFINDPNYQFIEGDIRDLDTCINSTVGVDYVLHQAA